MVKSQISIKLDKQQLSCEYICKHIQQLINNHTNQNINLANYLLICELKEVTDSNQSLLLRIGVNHE